MRSTLLARADSLDSLAAIIHSLCRGSSTYLVQWPIVTRSTFAGLCKLRTTKQGQVLSTNAMTVIRTGQQNCEDLELWKRVKSGNFVRKKSGQRSAIDEEAFGVFCLAAYVLQLADACWNTPRKMMSQYVFYSEECAILSDRNERFIYKSGGNRQGQLYPYELQAHG